MCRSIARNWRNEIGPCANGVRRPLQVIGIGRIRRGPAQLNARLKIELHLSTACARAGDKQQSSRCQMDGEFALQTGVHRKWSLECVVSIPAYRLNSDTEKQRHQSLPFPRTRKHRHEYGSSSKRLQDKI